MGLKSEYSTAWIQKPGSGETMNMRRDCEWTLSHASSDTNILNRSFRYFIFILFYCKAFSRCGGGRNEWENGVLGKVDQGFGEADLPEHLVARDGPLARRVEEDVRLFFGILVVVLYGGGWFERRVVDGEVEEGGRQSGHLCPASAGGKASGAEKETTGARMGEMVLISNYCNTIGVRA